MEYPRHVAFAEVDWGEELYAILRRQMIRQSFSFARLADRFQIVGLPETAKSLRAKLRETKVSATLYFQCLALMDVYDLDDIGYSFKEVIDRQREVAAD